jgi:hypothetical protein
VTPTNELRFVLRGQLPPILQQKWIEEVLNSMTGQYGIVQEWRDVPVVKEEE